MLFVVRKDNRCVLSRLKRCAFDTFYKYCGVQFTLLVPLSSTTVRVTTGRQTSSEDATFTCSPFQENCTYNDLSLTNLAIAVCAKVVRFCNIRQLFAVSCLYIQLYSPHNMVAQATKQAKIRQMK